jgi:hypothetical protein
MTIKRRVASTMLAAIAYRYTGVTAPGISRRRLLDAIVYR